MDEAFIVEQYPSNPRLELMAEAIKHAEPVIRAHGRAFDWDEFNQFLEAGALNGVLSNPEEAAAAVDKLL